MNDAVLCPVNPIGHEWDGLGCRWCPATRTPGEAIVSGLASRRGGNRGSAQALLDAYRVDVLTKAGVEYEDCDVCGAARGVGKPCNTCAFEARIAAELAGREEATAAAATATPDFFQPRHTYMVRGFAYHCKHTTHHPAKGEREAWGWLHRGGAIWRLERLYDADYTADVARSGEASRG